ncbi:putative ABC transporter family protein [Monocercomonoides exilis]|uniref:putative ABC transporter family protein n=1 Tax=Monocercomonoides exilis TaxID=2049356 RepID=UPI00355940A7|nr:putative ABC transporter family protein [Monocercomonoides exilis]|eukprot:MONOS_11587.1-p1 / transcript=MONOS_11587.1 / gene=MONOS_11587 / organism=Monocercomonoides_exilis_PA203 / gene_product=ABC transporter family protein / transcript_product=ABC transporter family protein / location=Mono_scaffold00589:13173-17125(-) / protein_length=835 / sequence_SO=supercontig / SO=protein_coding / is_pseudo=false
MQYAEPSSCGILSTFKSVKNFMVMPLDVYFSVKTLVTFFGKSSFCVVLMVIIDSPISAWISRQTQKQYERYRGESDRTDQTTIEVFDQIKLIKINGWEEMIKDKLLQSGRRQDELIRKGVLFNTIGDILQSLVKTLTLIVLVGLRFWQHLPLKASALFPSIRIVESLRTSLNGIPSMLNSIRLDKADIERMEMLLQADESPDRYEEKEREEGKEKKMEKRRKRGRRSKKLEELSRKDKSSISLSSKEDSKSDDDDGGSEAYQRKMKENVEKKENGRGKGKEEKERMKKGREEVKDKEEKGDKEENNDNNDTDIVISLTNASFAWISTTTTTSSSSSSSSRLSSFLHTFHSNFIWLYGLDVSSYVNPLPPPLPSPLPILRNISFSLPRHSHTLIFGPVGCGKTALLASILGETICGDEAEVGERGYNLSGGQRVRIALARAACSSAEVFLLDDILASVDAHVGQALVIKCISQLLKGKTVLLATHHTKYLPYFDTVIAMEEDGSIRKIGRAEEFKGIVKEMGVIVKEEKEGGGEEEEEKKGGERERETLGDNFENNCEKKIEYANNIPFLSSSSSSPSQEISFLFFIFFAASLFFSFSKIPVRLLSNHFQQQSAHAIKTDMYTKLFHAQMRFFDTTPASMLYRRLNAVNSISYSVLHSFNATASSLAKQPLAMVAIPSAMPELLLLHVVLATRRFFKQCVEGAATIRAFGVQEAVEERQRELCRSQCDVEFYRESVRALVVNISSWCYDALELLTYLTAIVLKAAGRNTYFLPMALQMSHSAVSAGRNLYSQLLSLYFVVGKIGRIRELCDVEQEGECTINVPEDVNEKSKMIKCS